MQIILKILLVIVITIIGGAITCGGNIFIDGLLTKTLNEYGSDYAIWLYLLWFLEIIVIIYFAVDYEFYKKNTVSLTIQSIIILIIILLGAFFFFGNWAYII